jgi:hypothetical protein
MQAVAVAKARKSKNPRKLKNPKGDKDGDKFFELSRFLILS